MLVSFCPQSGEWLKLKVLEVEPQLTKLGTSLEEATEYLNAHNEVLFRLQVKKLTFETEIVSSALRSKSKCTGFKNDFKIDKYLSLLQKEFHLIGLG